MLAGPMGINTKRKICLGLLRTRFYLVKVTKKKPMARPEKDGVAINCLSNPNLAPAMATNMFSLFHF